MGECRLNKTDLVASAWAVTLCRTFQETFGNAGKHATATPDSTCMQ